MRSTPSSLPLSVADVAVAATVVEVATVSVDAAGVDAAVVAPSRLARAVATRPSMSLTSRPSPRSAEDKYQKYDVKILRVLGCRYVPPCSFLKEVSWYGLYLPFSVMFCMMASLSIFTLQ